MKKGFILFLTPLLIGCSISPNPGPIDPPDPPDPPGPITDLDVFDDEDKLYNSFFSYTSKIEIKLKFTNQAIYKLAQYGISGYFDKEEMYHPCEATFTINDVSKTFSGVGARMKGNTSRDGGFVSEDGYFTDSERKCHFKLSFKETFEDTDYYSETFESQEAKEARKDRRFGGMKKLDFKWNKNYDYSFTKEAYANYCLNDVGVAAQKTNLISLTVESDVDSFTQEYLAMEAVDKPMLKKQLGKDQKDGDLYKCLYPANLVGVGSYGVESANFKPRYAIKTNEDTTDHSNLLNFLNTINKKGPVSTMKSEIDSVVDVDYFLRYSAIMWVIGNPDDMRNNTNNTYLYFSNKTNKMIPIPYDNDRCFGILKDWNIDTSNVPCTTTKRVGANREWNENPLLWRLIISENSSVSYSDNYPVISEYKTQYEKYCAEYATKYLNVEKYENFTNQFYYSNKDISNPGVDNMTFETYAKAKLATLK